VADFDTHIRGLTGRFIRWSIKRSRRAQRVVTFDDKFLFHRFEFLRSDEWPDSWLDDLSPKARAAWGGKRPNALPWWLPLNAFLHSWNPEPGSEEGFHDHPRWSVTICLSGRIIERTPWGDRLLTPGSIVVRSRKAIHAFKVPDDHTGEIWTLFIVGRRKARQNTYLVTAR
jgi:hypothetical protein